MITHSMAPETATQTKAKRNFSSNETLLIAFFIASLFHLFFIFGISFTIDQPEKKQQSLTMDVVLVNTESEEPPEQEDYLAQANQIGGGTLETKAKPTSTAPGKTPAKGNAAETRPAAIPKPEVKKEPEKSILSSTHTSPKKAPRLTPKKKPVPPKKLNLNTNYLSDLQQQIVAMEAELDAKNRAYAKRPKATYITASTKHAAEAYYLSQWTKKIERIGNLNYPDKARRNKLEGQLLLTVTLRADGSVVSIKIGKSSGHKILDDAAKRIVELSSPFSPVPKEVLRGNTLLVITRTWQFTQTSSGKLIAK